MAARTGAGDAGRREPGAAAVSETAPGSRLGRGFAYAATGYTLWGVLPLYFALLAPTGPVEIVAWRIVFALGFCVVLIAATGGRRRLGALLRDLRLMGIMLVAAALIYGNWLVYVYATTSGHVVEASLGYFINPLVSVALGLVVLHERLTHLQWAGVGCSVVAVVVLTAGYGEVPWIALALAFSFGLYGLVKHRVGPRVDALSGLTVETAWLVPLAVAQLVVLGGDITFGTIGTWHSIALVAAGAVTAVPLLCFAAGARRLPLAVLGLVQYVTPMMQFLIGVLVMREPMPPGRLAGFALVWAALACIIADALLRVRIRR